MRAEATEVECVTRVQTAGSEPIASQHMRIVYSPQKNFQMLICLHWETFLLDDAASIVRPL